jgi:hypothetical protein
LWIRVYRIREGFSGLETPWKAVVNAGKSEYLIPFALGFERGDRSPGRVNVRVTFRAWRPLLPVLVALACAGAPDPALGQSSPNVSLDHPSYRFTEFLDTLGLVDSRLAGVRPYTRLEMSRLLVEARDLIAVRTSRRSDLIGRKIDLFLREFRPESGRLLFTDAGEGETYLKPVQSLRARYVYKEGIETPERDFGRSYNAGSQLFGGCTLHGSLFDVLSFHARPEARLHFHNWEGEARDQYRVSWLETYGKIAVWNVEIEGGIDSMAWGPGAHDGLLLGSSAEPFYLVKLSNPVPTLLPWIFEVLGPVRVQAFLTRLSTRRVVQKPWLAGMKLNIKPLPFLEVGASRSFIFGGEDRPPPNLWYILKGTEDNPDPGEPDLSNQLAGFDMRVRIPLPGGGMALYTEAIGEDEAGNMPYKWSFLHGVHVAGILPGRNLWLRVEWAETHKAAYVHGTYATGYTYRLDYPGHTVTNSSIGHHVGNRSRDLYCEVGLFPVPEAELILFGDWEERKRFGAAVPEEHVQVGGSASYRFVWLGGFTASAELRYRSVRNEGYVKKDRVAYTDFALTFELQF